MEHTVVIVDQDARARVAAETLLRRHGRHVVAVRDGAAACDIVRCEGAALVLLSLHAASRDSLALLQRLRGQLESFVRPTPLIVVVAHRGQRDIKRRALGHGADAVLRKPTAPSQLIAAVERLMVPKDVRASEVPLS